MQVGDLVIVKLPSVVEYLAIIVRPSFTPSGSALARSVDARFPTFEHWVAPWSSEVISESR
jgi:hypothetical protein